MLEITLLINQLRVSSAVINAFFPVKLCQDFPKTSNYFKHQVYARFLKPTTKQLWLLQAAKLRFFCSGPMLTIDIHNYKLFVSNINVTNLVFQNSTYARIDSFLQEPSTSPTTRNIILVRPLITFKRTKQTRPLGMCAWDLALEDHKQSSGCIDDPSADYSR